MRLRNLLPLLCALALGLTAATALATTTSSSTVSPTLVKQAHELYAPANRFEHSLTAHQRALLRTAAKRAGDKINRCTKPYNKQLIATNTKSGRTIRTLWEDAGTEQTYQADVAPAAKQLKLLTSRWAKQHLGNRTMDRFAHGTAGEIRLSLNSAPMNTCTFIKQMAAHHFSAAWATRSAYGKEAVHWSKSILKEANLTNKFWIMVGATGTPGPYSGLFTNKQLGVLTNIPGETN